MSSRKDILFDPWFLLGVVTGLLILTWAGFFR